MNPISNRKIYLLHFICLLLTPYTNYLFQRWDTTDSIYKTSAKQFDSREAAMDWIDVNKLGRRNLTPDQASVLRDRRYNRQKKAVGKPAGYILGQNDPISTAEILAKEYGVSPSTIKCDGAIYGIKQSQDIF